MASQVQLRRGTTAENNAFTGAVGEVTVDTDRNEIRLHDGATAGGRVIGDIRGVNSGVTASTTQTQGQEPQTERVVEVSVCANTNDTITLPEAAAGKDIFIRNNGANTLQIFPASGDAINGGSVDAAVTLAAGGSVKYFAIDAINWYS